MGNHKITDPNTGESFFVFDSDKGFSDVISPDLLNPSPLKKGPDPAQEKMAQILKKLSQKAIKQEEKIQELEEKISFQTHKTLSQKTWLYALGISQLILTLLSIGIFLR